MNKDYIYKRRLLKLANFLSKLPDERFNFGSWVGNDWEGKPNLSCGTTACALGWATTIPSFRKMGLVLRKNKHKNSSIVSLKRLSNRTLYAPEKASKELFDLSRTEHEALFIPGGDLDAYLTERATAKQVANHIRKFVKQKYPAK